MSPRTWLEQALTAAAPAIMREFERQLADPTDEYLGTTVQAEDPIVTALRIIDDNLRRRAATPADCRGPAWRHATNVALDYRLRLMTDRDRGSRIVDRRSSRP